MPLATSMIATISQRLLALFCFAVRLFTKNQIAIVSNRVDGCEKACAGARAMLRYFDRQGKPLTHDQWAEKFKDRDYSIVKSSRIGDTKIVTSWVGVHWSDARKRLLFLLQVFELDREASHLVKHKKLKLEEKWKFKDEEWLPTEAAAVQAHEEFLQAV